MTHLRLEPSLLDTLGGKVAVLTGGATGIGRSTVQQLCSESTLVAHHLTPFILIKSRAWCKSSLRRRRRGTLARTRIRTGSKCPLRQMRCLKLLKSARAVQIRP
jgi:hypothetical protein